MECSGAGPIRGARTDLVSSDEIDNAAIASSKLEVCPPPKRVA